MFRLQLRLVRIILLRFFCNNFPALIATELKLLLKMSPQTANSDQSEIGHDEGGGRQVRRTTSEMAPAGSLRTDLGPML